MATTVTPTYSAPHNGILGDASATAGAGQVNQFLGTHGIQAVYQGNSILTANGSGASAWKRDLSSTDVDQPFTMSGTAIGRVAVPLLPVGDGADLLVSLCADNAGAPGTVITQSRIPANWIYQLAAVSGIPAGTTFSTQLTDNPLATAQFNGTLMEASQTTNWPYPYTTSTAAPSATYYGNYMVQVGGVASGAAISAVFTIPYSQSGSTGVLSQAIPQASFPTTYDGSGKMCPVIDAVTGSPVLVLAGGSTTFFGTPSGAVYTASIDPTTGQLSAWSTQTSLPYVVQNQATCSYNGYVYVLGGIPDPGGNPINTVSYAQVQNGQITGWNTGTPMPVATQLSFVTATQGFLFLMAGEAVSGNITSTWYAPIHSDGSIGAWVPGPSLPVAIANLNETVFSNDQMIYVTSDVDTLCGLGVSASGPASEWNSSGNLLSIFNGAIDEGNGTVLIFGLRTSNYVVFPICLTPYISVPLPATGLTNGATYHILMQQQGGDLNDYLRMHQDHNVFPGNPAAQTSPRGAYTWTSAGGGNAVPIQIFDQTVGGPALHLWADNGARITTIVSATTPDQRVLGVCEATRQAAALNTNTGFESGISPWTVTGGTGAQSTTQVYEGQYALQITPSGSASNVIAASEIMPCMPGQWCTATGWTWFTSAVTSNFSMSITWYTAVSGGTQISTSSSPVSVAASTWTSESQTLQAPAGAYGFQIQATLSGTPSSSQHWYLDVARAHYTYAGPQNSTVSQITYSGTWPAPAQGTGVTQLA